MEPSESNQEKLYYSIGEVAGILHVNTSLIRFWEKEFSIIKPYRDRKGKRFFKPEDIRVLKVIHHLVKEKGYTLEGARKSIKENNEKLLKSAEIIESLKKIRTFLLEINKSL